MKKNMILAAGAVLVAAAVSAFVYVNNGKNSMSDLFNANVEALASGEIGEIPCLQAVSTCFFVVKDAGGNYYNASVTGMRNI